MAQLVELVRPDRTCRLARDEPAHIGGRRREHAETGLRESDLRGRAEHQRPVRVAGPGQRHRDHLDPVLLADLEMAVVTRRGTHYLYQAAVIAPWYAPSVHAAQ